MARKQSPFLTVAEAAEFLRIKERTLDNMRWRGEGPHWRKHGGTVVHHIDDLIGWSRENDFGFGDGYDAATPPEDEPDSDQASAKG